MYRSMTRAEIHTTFGRGTLPERLGAGPLEVFEGIDDGRGRERCTVACGAGYAFCLSCERFGSLEGYLADFAGVELWHRE